MKKKAILLVLGTLFLFWGTPSDSAASDTWFMDTRNVTRQGGGADPGLLTVQSLVQTSPQQLQWIPSSFDRFLATHQPNKPLIIAIHGNLMTYPEARQHAARFHQMLRNMPDHRLIVWSWPADRVSAGPKKDALYKARQADGQAKYLAGFLRRLPSGSKVSLVGFSFGSKLVCETLEQMVRTSPYSNNSLDGYVGHQLRLRTILLAAAMDQSSLAPGQKYGHALLATEKMLIHVDFDDEVLVYYPLLVGICGPKALGRDGLSTSGMPANYLNKIRSVRMDLPEHMFINSFRGLLADQAGFLNYGLFLGN